MDFWLKANGLDLGNLHRKKFIQRLWTVVDARVTQDKGWVSITGDRDSVPAPASSVSVLPRTYYTCDQTLVLETQPCYDEKAEAATSGASHVAGKQPAPGLHPGVTGSLVRWSAGISQVRFLYQSSVEGWECDHVPCVVSVTGPRWEFFKCENEV